MRSCIAQLNDYFLDAEGSVQQRYTMWVLRPVSFVCVGACLATLIIAHSLISLFQVPWAWPWMGTASYGWELLERKSRWLHGLYTVPPQ
jgi:hypothetical protein